MHQSINKKKIYFYLVSFLFISTIFNNNLISNLKDVFKVREVKVENVKKEINDNILSNTNFLLGENIFFVNKNFLLEKFDKLNFIESISIKKKYPSIINIQTKQTNLIAITYLDQKKYFIGQNGKFIIAKQISNKKKLPTIFGKFKPDDYIFLQRELLSQKIDLNEITRYYFHKNKRWDLYFANNIIIQLPNKNISEAINLFKKFTLKNNILKTLTKLNEYGEVLLEKYITGREIQVAILENKVLGAIELRPTRKFYDYQAKYNPKARTEHIIPVEISKRKYQELTKIALKAHKILKCRGVTRSDFRYYKNSFYLLETNTQPGMTSLSLVPEIANFNNITFKNLIIKILEDASINK